MILLFAIYFRKKGEMKSLIGDKRLNANRNFIEQSEMFCIFIKFIQILNSTNKIPFSLLGSSTKRYKFHEIL